MWEHGIVIAYDDVNDEYEVHHPHWDMPESMWVSEAITRAEMRVTTQ